MLRTIGLALDVLGTVLKPGDVRVALEFVNRVDEDVPPIGPETIEGVIDRMARLRLSKQWAHPDRRSPALREGLWILLRLLAN